MLPLFDSHCHLDFPQLRQDLAEYLGQGRRSGILHWLIPGYDLEHSEQAQELDFGAGVYRAVGIHPGRVASLVSGSSEDWRARLCAALEKPGVVAIGECGFDALCLKEASFRYQEEVFLYHLELALERELPIILHIVRLYPEFFRSVSSSLPLRGVVHGFTGDRHLAEKCLELGLHLGIGPQVLRKNAEKFRSMVTALPLERLLLETDAPSSKNGSGTENPLLLTQVCEEIAALKKISPWEVAQVTKEAAESLFVRA
ncbi:MAG: TatD family hydrolase [Polyangiaceae bacterium]|nr:TatD family hydrolase [Polyangiaceae bacterium]